MSLNQVQAYLERLVSFNTSSHRSNLDLVSWLEVTLAGMGVSAVRVPSPDGRKASLFATIGDPATGRGVGLSGHTDVVPVEGQRWGSDPFVLRAQEGRLYGRGTCDMKGFLACMLAAVPLFQARALSTPVHLLFSYDEEVGCTGVRPMIAELGQALPKPHLVIVGEPTGMQVVDAHKGIFAFATEVQGLEAHSSAPQRGVNAVAVACDLVGYLGQLGQEVAAGEVTAAARRFDPPYSTVHVGTIAGGTAQNIVPGRCRFTWEYRAIPGDRQAAEILPRFNAHATELLPAMRQVDAGTAIETVATHQVPAFAADRAEGGDAVALALRLAEQNETFAVSYGTEAGLFEAAGCATVVCGPGHIAQAHKPDEYVEMAQLAGCMAFMEKLAEHLAA